MAGKLIDIIHQHSSALHGRRSAYSPAQRNPDAGRQSLKRPQYELAIFIQVKANPVDLLQKLIQKRRRISEIGYSVRLSFQQRPQLRLDDGVLLFTGSSIFFGYEHGISTPFVI